MRLERKVAIVFLAEQKTLALTGLSILLTHGWFME
jgi:hypothetical protein